MESLRKRGHEVALCALRKPIEGKCFKEYLELEHVFEPALLSKLVIKGKLLKVVFQVSSAVKKCTKQFKPDATVCFGEVGSLRGVNNPRVTKILYVHFPTEVKAASHSLPYLIYRIPYWYWHYRELPTLDAIVCNSQYTKGITYALYQYIVPERQKYRVIYPPINMEDFKGPAKREDKICYVGRIDIHKGINHVVKSFLRIYGKVKVHLDIVGGITETKWSKSYYESRLKPWISRLQGKYPISLKVNVPYREVVETLLASKAMVSYNPEEHFGIVPVEAQACGCIPIVADGGGQRETVIHGKVGFRAKTPSELDKYVMLVLSDENLRKRISQNAKIWAENFSFSRIGDEWINLLETLVTK